MYHSLANPDAIGLRRLSVLYHASWLCVGLVVVAALAGCGAERTPEPKDAVADAADSAQNDSAPSDTGSDDALPVDATDLDGVGPDATVVPPDYSGLLVAAPLAVPADPLAATPLQSCALYQAERCQDGALQRCQLVHPATQQWIEAPDPLLRRALLMDRWRDLYNSPDGQAVDRNFNTATSAELPESVWGDPQRFASYDSAADGAIWTGWSTVAAVTRYAQTGTEAERARMTEHVRDLLRLFTVTGVPGYLARFHFLLLPQGAPTTPEHITRHEGSFVPTWKDRPAALDSAIALPEAYTTGVVDADGKVWQGQPMYHGNPSIDQYTGPMTALPMAYALLQDEATKQQIVYQLGCYQRRLQRIELRNLQKNPQILAAMTSYFTAGVYQPDPGDIDLTKRDTVVAYALRQVNSQSVKTMDLGCLDQIQRTPWRVLDASSETFLSDLLELVQDLQSGQQERENGIDHLYVPSLRAGDAMHLMHLSVINWWLSGNDDYKQFLLSDLIGQLDAVEVLATSGSFVLPKWCKEWFGDQITYGPWWAFLGLLQGGLLRDKLAKAFAGELWNKTLKHNGNLDFAIQYAGELDASVAPDREEVAKAALAALASFGGNGKDSAGQPLLDTPRRSYTLDPNEILASLPEGTSPTCPTAEELAICNTGPNFLGIPLPAPGVDELPCLGLPWQCQLPDGKCAAPMTNKALPPQLRKFSDFLWQRCPFCVGAWAVQEGGRQFAGSDFSVPYWNARRYGLVTAGAGQVLAWAAVGSCN